MEPPSSPSSPPLPRRRSHLRSATAGTLLRLLSLFPAGPAPPPSSDPSPPPDSGGSPDGGAVPEEAGEVVAGSSDVGVVEGVRKEDALSDGGIGRLRESAGGDGRSSLDCGGIGASAMVDDDVGGILPIEVALDCSISSGLLLGNVEVEDMILDQDQAAGENGEVEREDCPDSRIEDWAKKEDRIGAVEKQIAANVVEHGLLHPGIVLDTYKNVESCKPEEVAARKHTDICAAFDEDKEIEEGEIPGEVDLSMLLSDQDPAVVHDIDRKQACLSATKEDFGPVGLISNARSLSFSEGCGRKVQSDVSLSKRANVVEMNSGYGGSCISKEENICESRGREKREVTNGVVVSPKKDGVRLKKKKQASVSDQKKAKKKIAKKRRRAEINKKLGVKRLKLVPISKPKVVKICKHYLHGRCQQGDECKFSHDAVPFTKSQPCKHFARDSCLKGDDCPFDHELFKYPCHNYMHRGSCFRGDSCLFSHKVQLSQDNSNASEVKCRVVPERASLGKDCQRNSKTPLAINTLSRAGTSPSTTSTLQKSSLTQQPNDLFSAEKLDPYVMRTPPKGITFLSFCSDTTTLNEFSNNRKETVSTPTFKNMSEGKMPSLFTSLHSPSSSHKMLMPVEVSNFASSSHGNEGNGFMTQSAAPKLQSSQMDASQMLEEFLFSGG